MPYSWENKDIDQASASELYNWIKNDSVLYDRQYTPINKNLAAKKARGVYNSTLAAKLFGYLAESGAKRYDEEVNGAPKYKGKIPSYFTKKVRDAVAEELRDDFEEEWENGSYREYIPKKYQPKPAKVAKKATRKKSSGKAKTSTTMRGMR